jgi:ketosteroid isomerase-like protein
MIDGEWWCFEKRTFGKVGSHYLPDAGLRGTLADVSGFGVDAMVPGGAVDRLFKHIHRMPIPMEPVPAVVPAATRDALPSMYMGGVRKDEPRPPASLPPGISVSSKVLLYGCNRATKVVWRLFINIVDTWWLFETMGLSKVDASKLPSAELLDVALLIERGFISSSRNTAMSMLFDRCTELVRQSWRMPAPARGPLFTSLVKAQQARLHLLPRNPAKVKPCTPSPTRLLEDVELETAVIVLFVEDDGCNVIDQFYIFAMGEWWLCDTSFQVADDPMTGHGGLLRRYPEKLDIFARTTLRWICNHRLRAGLTAAESILSKARQLQG